MPRHRVLLVEDDDAHAMIVETALTDAATLELVRVRGGREALGVLRDEGRDRPDLVLLDLKLPGFSGIDVLRQIREHEDLNDVPVVILSTSAAEVDIRAAYDCGVSSYLVKPADYNELCDLMASTANYWLRWNQRPPARRRNASPETAASSDEGDDSRRTA